MAPKTHYRAATGVVAALCLIPRRGGSVFTHVGRVRVTEGRDGSISKHKPLSSHQGEVSSVENATGPTSVPR